MSEHDSTLADLLVDLRRLRVRLWVKNDELRCDAPKGAVTLELQQQIKANKSAIVALLSSNRVKTEATEDWRADVVLPESIQLATKIATPISTPKQIFLTGATGFLGAFLLAELMQQTTAHVHCLVRASSETEAKSRLQNTLESYGIWQSDFTNRVTAVAGDLSKPKLGIQPDRYEQLATEMDVIYHNGAHVHHGLPYAKLQATNVAGTREILLLACKGGTPFHYVSSLSVLPPASTEEQQHFLESDPLENFPPPQGGYNLTKWVAEQLVAQAGDRGLPVTVYRPGPISGHSETGKFNRNDFLYRLMQGYVQSGLAPDGELLLDLLPVDYASRAIVWLSIQRNVAAAQATYHLLHPEPASSNLLFEACQNAGYEISRVPYELWFEHLKRIARERKTEHALYPLVTLFASRQIQKETESTVPKPIPFDSSQAKSALQNAPFPLPKLEARLFETYLAAMIKQGIINPPTTQQTVSQPNEPATPNSAVTTGRQAQ